MVGNEMLINYSINSVIFSAIAVFLIWIIIALLDNTWLLLNMNNKYDATLVPVI